MHPVLFHIGSFELRVWGLMVFIGILSGSFLATRLGKKEGFSQDLIIDFAFYACFAGIIGARVWEVAFSWENYANNPLSALMLWSGGMSIQGAVVGGLLATIWYVRKHKINFWRFGDVLVPAVILGQAIGRVGCLFNGDAYGIPTNGWWGVVYKPGTPAFEAYGATPLVPAELMEGTGDLLILAILLLINRRKPYPGFLSLLYFVLYSLLRFVLEFWRGDSLVAFNGIKAAQLSSLLIAIVAGTMAIAKYIKSNKE